MQEMLDRQARDAAWKRLEEVATELLREKSAAAKHLKQGGQIFSKRVSVFVFLEQPERICFLQEEQLRLVLDGAISDLSAKLDEAYLAASLDAAVLGQKSRIEVSSVSVWRRMDGLLLDVGYWFLKYDLNHARWLSATMFGSA